MALPNLVFSVASEYDGKGLGKARKDVNSFSKTVKNLAKTLGATLSVAALVNYSKAAIRAFAADENAARSLGMTLKNLNLDYFGASSAVNLYISNLEKQTGVLDDQLRPAMDRLLRATGSITESQKLLNLALDISAGTGKDLTAVSQGLQKAYLGNNASLGRLGVGLTKAELTTSSFVDIQERLTQLFAGQALSASEGYQGSINKLTIASNNAKEIIGKDLLDSMQLIAGKDGIGGATTAIENFATQIGNAIYGIGVLTAKLNSLPGGGFVTDVLSGKYGILGLASEFGKSQKAPTGQQSPGGAGAAAARMKYEREQNKILKTKNALSKTDNDNTVRKLILTGDALALMELEKEFDVERIGLYAALNGATDNETKMRLLSLIAINEQNGALAGLIGNTKGASDAFAVFKENFKTAVQALIDAVNVQIEALAKMFPEPKVPGTPSVGGGGSSGNVSDEFVLEDPYNFGQFRLGEKDTMLEYLAGSSSAPAGSTVININASGIGDQQIAAVVQNAMQQLNRYGNSTTFAGAL
jgi:hypothetical protein